MLKTDKHIPFRWDFKRVGEETKLFKKQIPKVQTYLCSQRFFRQLPQLITYMAAKYSLLSLG